MGFTRQPAGRADLWHACGIASATANQPTGEWRGATDEKD